MVFKFLSALPSAGRAGSRLANSVPKSQPQSRLFSAAPQRCSETLAVVCHRAALCDLRNCR